ncbi:MAG: TlpA family protein disulfide reductase [Actinomycetes bacterium]
MSAGRTAALLLVLAAVTGCGGEPSPGTGPGVASPGGDRTAVARDDSQAGADTPAEADAQAEADLPPCPAGADVASRDEGLPRLTLDCLGEGPAVTLSGLRGKPLVVTVWASWCPPCAQEMPRLEQVRRETQGRVQFLGIDLLDRAGPALDAAAGFGMGFPSVQDPDGHTRQALAVPGPPVTLFVDAEGRVVHREVGEITSTDAVRDLVRRHLQVTA